MRDFQDRPLGVTSPHPQGGLGNAGVERAWAWAALHERADLRGAMRTSLLEAPPLPFSEPTQGASPRAPGTLGNSVTGGVLPFSSSGGAGACGLALGRCTGALYLGIPRPSARLGGLAVTFASMPTEVGPPPPLTPPPSLSFSFPFFPAPSLGLSRAFFLCFSSSEPPSALQSHPDLLCRLLL